MTDFSTITDEQLVSLSKEGNKEAEEFLYGKYKALVRAKARSYYLTGADNEDLLQEGMFGLFKAVCDYSPEKKVPFASFADLCVTRQIQTAVKTANRKKHLPLNTYVSLYQPVPDAQNTETEVTLSDLIPEDEQADPENSLIGKESYQNIIQNIDKRLSKLEKQILSLYLKGFSYMQISKQVNRNSKSVDNAIQRIKKKLGDLI